MEKRTVVVDTSTLSSPPGVTSVTLEIIPDSGYVVAARDFVAGANPDTTGNIIDSITLADSESSGGPQNDGSYTANNKVIVTVDFDNDWEPTENITFDIDPSGSATAKHLVPVKLQGTFAVPAAPDKVTFTASSVLDFASSGSTTDFYAYDNPGDLITIMVMTIAATSGDFIDEDPTIAITNSGDSTAEDDYTITRVNTFDSSDRLTQAVYTVKATMPKVSRSSDVITFTGAGDDIPSTDSKIYGYKMDTNPAGLFIINRRLEVFADEGAEFRIKMQRGTISGSTFTADSTDGIYLFDNSLETIADAFAPSTSTVTYPSEIQSGGTYAAATNPYTMTSTGIFFKNIVIPADTEDKVYRFTITPEGSTTVDPDAPGYLDVTPDPDVITFDITRNDVITFEVDNNSASRTTTETVEYFNYLDESIGTTKPRGKKETEPNAPINQYRYELIIRDQTNDFYLPNNSNSYFLNNMNYTKTLNDGSTTNYGVFSDPIVHAELRATSDGFFAGEINTTESADHSTADSNDTLSAITLTLAQRQALTNKAAFNAFSWSDVYTVVGDDGYFKVHFYTTDDTPVYKSQTILITDEGDVGGGDDNQQNTTTLSTPSVDREYLYLNGSGLNIYRWGDSNMDLDHDLDTFTTTSAPSATTLSISFNIAEGVRKFVNELARAAGYTTNYGYSISQTVATDGGGVYSKQNITTSTTNVKFTITGAFLNGQDRLPKDFDTADYTLLASKTDSSSDLDAATISVDAQPTVTLTNGSAVNRNLAVASFDIIVDFGNAPTILASLSGSSNYFMDIDIVHRLSDDYADIADIEDSYGYSADDTELATY